MKTDKQIAAAAAEFAARWKGRGYERGESQPFWIDLLSNVFGIETPTDGFIRFSFKNDVLINELPPQDYWQIKKVTSDIAEMV